MIIENSTCGNFAITKSKTSKTCSGFVFTLNDKEACGTLYPFYETGTLSIMKYWAEDNGILFNQDTKMKTERIEIRVPTEMKDKIYRASKGKISAWVRTLISAELNKK